jgi:predicted amidohydrolase
MLAATQFFFRGTVTATTGHEEDIICADVSVAKVEEVRSSIPTRNQKRYDVYTRSEDIKK